MCVALLAGCAPAPATTSPAPSAAPHNGPGTGPAKGTGPPQLNPRGVFVAPEGNDAATGQADEPYATVARGLSAVRPGETLYIHGGTYRENITNVDLTPGTPEQPILVRPFPREQVLIEGLLWLRHPSYWSIAGIDVTWRDGNEADKHMVKITGGRGWSFRDAEISGARSFAGLLVVGDPDDPSLPADWRVSDNCIRDTHPTNGRNEDHLVYVNSGVASGPGVVADNLLFSAPNGAGVKLGGPAPDDGGAARVTVTHNTIVDAAQSVMLVWQASRNRIERNLMVSTEDDYAAIRAYELAYGDNVAGNNLAFDTSGMFLNDEGYAPVVDGGGNRTDLDPELTAGGCDGLRSTTTSEYGRRFDEVAAGPS